jgi:Tfp pilus assembly protein PilX
MRRSNTAIREDRRTDQGAALILAIVFLLAMSILVVVLGNLATEASTTTVNVRDQTTVEADAESAGTFAIQQVRRSYSLAPYGSPPGQFASPTNCLPATALSGPLTQTPYQTSLTVFCAGSQLGSTRTVNFYVCGPSSASASQCTQPNSKNELLYASVTYVDAPSGDLPLSASCGSTSSATCGVTMTINEWDVRTADN